MKTIPFKNWKVYTYRVAAGEGSYNIKFSAPDKTMANKMRDHYYAEQNPIFTKEVAGYSFTGKLSMALWAKTLDLMGTALTAPGATLMTAITKCVKTTTDYQMKGLLMWMGYMLKDRGYTMANFAPEFVKDPVADTIIQRTLFREHTDRELEVVCKTLAIVLKARCELTKKSRHIWAVVTGCSIAVPIMVAVWQLQVIAMMVEKLPYQTRKKLLQDDLTRSFCDFNQYVTKSLFGGHTTVYAALAALSIMLLYGAYKLLTAKSHSRIPWLGRAAQDLFAYRTLGDFTCAASASKSDQERTAIVADCAKTEWEVHVAKKTRKSLINNQPFQAAFLSNYSYLRENAEMLNQVIESHSEKIAAEEGANALRALEVEFNIGVKSYTDKIGKIYTVTLGISILVMAYNLFGIWEVMGAATQ